MTSFKCTEVSKTTLTYDLKEALTTKAHLAGCDNSEYLRDLICMDLLGVTWGEHVANHRRSVLGKQGLQLAQPRPSA
jgi:hypothetical protein